MAIIDSGKNFDKDEQHEKMKTLMVNKDTTQYTFRIPCDLYKKVKIKLANDEKKLRSVLLESLHQYLKGS